MNRHNKIINDENSYFFNSIQNSISLLFFNFTLFPIQIT